ncbi:hypothetical protein BWX42_00055 [Dolosigranulum pigrum]|uniref:Uncharacterized protein n=1 Tax=Dolosigranulum pigrum TaxID=29394 RepID=A0A1S8KR23_9LACT|nr:hypothetical protein BWX42_00350 [Dolosigranulum pigrum]OOL81969.1 hypothetical protein BWX42_09980 [Dolosigranulum pigrum]OOL81973.1 hypothetical protein BWX42_10020 [Dolosigranulum pigrum]OOL82160.1 hypothetical protein BWX42_00055 [Dolosigranulum pigrum]
MADHFDYVRERAEQLDKELRPELESAIKTAVENALKDKEELSTIDLLNIFTDGLIEYNREYSVILLANILADLNVSVRTEE